MDSFVFFHPHFHSLEQYSDHPQIQMIGQSHCWVWISRKICGECVSIATMWDWWTFGEKPKTVLPTMIHHRSIRSPLQIVSMNFNELSPYWDDDDHDGSCVKCRDRRDSGERGRQVQRRLAGCCVKRERFCKCHVCRPHRGPLRAPHRDTLLL